MSVCQGVVFVCPVRFSSVVSVSIQVDYREESEIVLGMRTIDEQIRALEPTKSEVFSYR